MLQNNKIVPRFWFCFVIFEKSSSRLWPFLKPRLWLWIQLGLAWPRRCLDNTERALRRDSDKRTESEAESKAEAVVSKRAYGSFIFVDKSITLF
jgi:hypothetical protein